MAHDTRRGAVVVDIETAALENAADFIPAPDTTMCRAPANWKDPEKIAAEIERQRAAFEIDYRAKLERCALDWNVSRIIAIGCWREGEESIQVFTAADEAAERSALLAFWKAAERRTIVGFCARNFDVPTLIQRSRYLGVPHPTVSLARFGKGDVVDLRDVLTFDDARYDAVMPRSLSAFCRRFGIDVEDPLTGADMAAAVREGRWSNVTAHVRADVAKTAKLAARLGLFNLESKPRSNVA